MNYGEVLHALSIDLQSFFRRSIKIDDASFPQILALAVVPDDGIEMSSLSKRLGLDSSTVTRLIIGLEKKGWAVRKKQKKDNRIIKVFLTSAGAEKQSQLEDKIDKLGSLIEKETDPFDRSELLEYLWSAHWTISKLLLKN
ncbi:MAG: MarR family transcriptional regulator [Candidatus Neomarinimicrobiota bacterium]|nr:MarR family transcriptional regulator [Candidatus Neomarinimicrobiota bacterium]